MSVLAKLDELKAIVDRRVTSGIVDNDEVRFQELRRELIADQDLAPALPGFVRDARTTEDVFVIISRDVVGGPGSWQRRKDFVSSGFTAAFRLAETPRDSVVMEIESGLDLMSSEGVKRAWERLIQRRETDPAAAITSARSLLESVCKTTLDRLGQSYARDESVVNLYVACAKRLGIHATSVGERVHRELLQTFASMVSAIGNVRNQYGDAHGDGQTRAELPAAETALVVDMAGALAVFVVRAFLKTAPCDGKAG